MNSSDQPSHQEERLLREFMHSESLPETFYSLAVEHFIPLANSLAKQQLKHNKTIIIGINGSQGSGKTTLTTLLRHLLQHCHQLNCSSLSIDDFYLSRSERDLLAEDVHPLLSTRGVPGTHDTLLLNNTLDALLKHQATIIPVFNKAQDDREPVDRWHKTNIKSDIILLEGWCLGISAQTDYELKQSINALEQKHDSDAIWRCFVNQQIKDHYQSLYDRVNIWMMLKAPSFDCVYQWRLEQEDKLREKLAHQPQGGSTKDQLMSAQQIQQFTQYFQRITEHGLKTLPSRVDYLLELDEHRNINNIVIT